MGGRGAISGSWKSQLKSMAAKGKMPKAIVGSLAQRSLVFKEINKLYPMPKTAYKEIVDQGDGIYINFGNSTTMSTYPSRSNATKAEKDGVKKWLLWRKQ